ncbi:MlaD family protein [Methylococcus capsulatus]|jgi:phospholipid/cholesterol/gamma-HCH transport system substrate-binding protein|uniref:Phospholipid/cholesterol/gamma-HCH transport system substrate-binding protein n=1 Tax=Methylococcus capsulatus TaxID=414 RepID=A0AA35UD59_METCP|nr:MlaD family protein [Methylococcus capsulatus]CAI8781105.1 phospholipid/cholesterol/gamma-HCH transport system substrate-binding protein [Methylococcus capsulatus]
MVRETYALLTGLFVVILGSALIGIALVLGDYGTERDVYVVSTQGAVSGLNPESLVIFRGVRAGKVASISFAPHDPRTILVRIEVDKGLPITRGTYATLRVQPLTGLAQIDLSDEGNDPEPLRTDPRNPASIPLRPSILDKLTGSGSDILTQIAQLTSRLNALLDDGNRQRIAHTLESLDTAADELVRLERYIEEGLERIPILDGRLRQALADHSAMARDVRETSRQVRALSESAQKVVDIGAAASDTLIRSRLPELDALIDDAAHTAASLRRLSKTLERDPQTLLLGPAPGLPGPGEPGFQEPK